MPCCSASCTQHCGSSLVCSFVDMLMSANTGKHGTGRKPYDARQHFIQTNRMANKMQRFVHCVHCTDAFEKGVPGAREVVDVRGEKNAMESHLC